MQSDDITPDHQKSTDADGKLTQSLLTEIHKIADRQIRLENPGHSLQATALVNEAWMVLAKQRNLTVSDRDSYLAAASNVIRRVLVDHARTKKRVKRGGPDIKKISLQLDQGIVANVSGEDPFDLLALDDALSELTTLQPRASHVVEMRYFGAMTNQEIADELGVALRTVASDWAVARSWLLNRLSD